MTPEGMKYDYLLVVGPGRSGSEFLYHLLKEHPDLAFPEIKEGIYYRSPGAFDRARRRLRGEPRLLCDIANSAYRDPALCRGVTALTEHGVRILLMVLLRDHAERAISMMQFRRSRGEPAALFGARRLQQATVRDRLAPDVLARIFRLDVDILTVTFGALTRNTAALLDVLAGLCRVSPFGSVPQGAVNEAVGARVLWLSAIGRSCGIALRKLGLRSLLQRIKDSASVRKVFFVPLAPDAGRPCLSGEARQTLAASGRACRSIVERSSEQIAAGVFFRPAS